MKLLAVAYPELSTTNYDLIQNYRKDHDELYFKAVKLHFSLVFPIAEFSPEEFKTEIRKQLTGVKQISFALRCATINKDAFTNYYHTFLVPDEGYSEIVKLHDKLYSDKLFPHLRLDLDFIPHIGVGNSTDKFICKQMVDEWNARDFEIRGTISSVDVVRHESDVVETLDKIALATAFKNT